MWTGLKEAAIENESYHGQISIYHGTVRAEILCKKEGYRYPRGDLYLTVADKSFSSSWFFTSDLKEEDLIKAKEWLKKQFDLLEKHGTKVVAMPDNLRNIVRDSWYKGKS